MNLRVVQVSCVIDPDRRSPEDLLAAWHTLPAVALAAARAGAEVTVLQASSAAAEIRRDGVRFRFVPEPAWRSRAGLFPWRLAGAIRELSPDVVHFNGLDFPAHARAACAAGAPLLVQDHSSAARSRIGPLRRWGYGMVAGSAFTSRDQAAPFVEAGQLPADIPIFEIPESSTAFRPGDREAARRETGMHGSPAVLWVGRLNAGKDPLTILKAVAIALRDLPELQLWCAFGDEEIRPEIEAFLARDERLARHVHLLGAVSHARVETLCRAADFFMSGSRREGSGYALLEAMACGLVPIVSDIPAFRALTGNGTVGAIAPVGDSEAFATALVRLAGEGRQFGKARVLDHFDRHLSFGAVGAQLVAAYARLAEDAR